MPAIERWDAFLAQIEGRARQVRDDATVAARALIAELAGGGDVVALSHQWAAVESRLQELEKMIIDTWHAKVDAAIDAEGMEAVRDAAYAKGQALARALDDTREELGITLLADLARVRGDTGTGSHALAQEAAVEEWRVMRAALRRLNDTRPPRTLALVQAYEAAQLAYWRVYLARRAVYEPILARDPAREIRDRMEQWYRTGAELEEAWVRAGRPRAPI